MMATIYGCATVTVVALAGKSANDGLAGVSVLRPARVNRTIEGRRQFTNPQEISVERSTAHCSTRARTLQEEILSMRVLQFAENQVDFSCLIGSVWEGTDPDTGFKGEWTQHSAQPLMRFLSRPELVSPSQL